MYQKIKAKFKANPTIFYACSIVASWAGVGSLMNFRTLAINNGAAAAIIWAVFNSLACIFFGLFAEYIPTVRRIMQSKVMFYFIGFLTVFQTWTQMSGIYEIFGDTPIGTTGGTLIVYGTCLVFLFMLLKEGMIRNVLSDGFSWVVVYGLLAVVVIAALVYTHGAFVNIDPGLTAAGIQTGLYKGFLLLPGPFTYPYYYSLFSYNDKNEDGTQHGNMKNPNIPTAGFEQFVKTLCKLMGGAIEMPYELLLKEFNASYSASRAALLEAWEGFKMRRTWLVDSFCQPAYEIWLSEAVARGRVIAPGFFDDPLLRAAWCGARWIGPVQGSLDPAKEVNAAILQTHHAFKTHEQVTLEMGGGDWTENAEQLARENELLKAAGSEGAIETTASITTQGGKQNAQTE